MKKIQVCGRWMFERTNIFECLRERIQLNDWKINWMCGKLIKLNVWEKLNLWVKLNTTINSRRNQSYGKIWGEKWFASEPKFVNRHIFLKTRNNWHCNLYVCCDTRSTHQRSKAEFEIKGASISTSSAFPQDVIITNIRHHC